ncbi:MAG: tetratricopeptide repeat protein [Candidatus Eiseniibacteriota bacterium]
MVARVASRWIVLLVGIPTMLLAPSSQVPADDAPADTVGAKQPAVAPAGDIRSAVEAGEWQRALELIRAEALQAEGEDEAELRLLEARVLVRAEDFAGAGRVYRRLVELPDRAAEARRELHELYVRQGRFVEAHALTEPGLADESSLATLRAYALSVEGRFAAAELDARAGERSGDARARILRANALLALGMETDAERIYLQVLREGTDRTSRQVAHFGLGQVARLKGSRAVRAMQDERAARIGPAPWAELDWGLALRALGRRAEAFERLEAVAELAPALAGAARLALARLDEEEGRVEDGIAHVTAALSGCTSDFLALTRLGELVLKQGRESDGIEAYRAALDIFPGFPPARERLARALAAAGRWDEAPGPSDEEARWKMPGWTWDRMLDGDLPFFSVVADRDSVPVDDPRRVVVALVHSVAGNPAAVLGWTEGAGPEHGTLAALRAEALEAVGRSADAVALWESILAGGDGGPIARERLARLVLPEDPARARSLWTDLLARYPGMPRARLRLAELLEAAGRPADALVEYRAAEGSRGLTAADRRRVRNAIEDLEDELAEGEEAKAES